MCGFLLHQHFLSNTFTAKKPLNPLPVPLFKKKNTKTCFWKMTQSLLVIESVNTEELLIKYSSFLFRCTSGSSHFRLPHLRSVSSSPQRLCFLSFLAYHRSIWWLTDVQKDPHPQICELRRRTGLWSSGGSPTFMKILLLFFLKPKHVSK